MNFETRRDFLKKAGALAAATVAYGSSGCAPMRKGSKAQVSLVEPNSVRWPLSAKAVAFQEAIDARHMSPEGLLLYRIDLDKFNGEPQYSNLADGAAWTGCYAATRALEFGAKGSPQARNAAVQSIKALHMLHEITGKPGLLARTLVRGTVAAETGEWHPGTGEFEGYAWRGDVSKDQYTGALFGYGVVYDLIPEEDVRGLIREDVAAIARHIIDNDLGIVDVDGRTTTYGDLDPSILGMKLIGLNALITLTLVKLAHHTTAEPYFAEKYQAMVNQGFPEAAVKAKFQFLGITNYSNDNMAYLCYYNLLRMENDPRLSDLYLKSLRRSWRYVAQDRNAFFNLVYAAFVDDATRQKAVEDACWTLRSFSTDKISIEVAKPQSTERPLPVWQRPASSFEWKSDPYRRAGHPGSKGNLEFTGADFLLAYWLGRYQGFIGD